jgi:hypothetical protein
MGGSTSLRYAVLGRRVLQDSHRRPNSNEGDYSGDLRDIRDTDQYASSRERDCS